MQDKNDNREYEYDEVEGLMFPKGGDIEIPIDEEMQEDPSIDYFEHYDDSISDIDFSQFKGDDFKTSFKKVNRQVEKNKFNKKRKKRKGPPPRIQKPLTQEIGVGNVNNPHGRDKAIISGPGEKKISRVFVPRSQKVIVEGVSKFILSGNESIKNTGYYKGEKLKKLILTFNNDSAIDFQLELFNTSMPLDYLQSTGLNLNSKIQVAGGAVSYTDVLFNQLANPMLIVNCTAVFSGPAVVSQMAQALRFQNKEATGDVKIIPLNLNLQIDNMQVFSDMVYFDIMKKLNRPFIPDGMDVIQYNIKAGMTVTLAFYYKQISLKKVLFPEARNSKGLM